MKLTGKTKEEFEKWYIALANEKGCFEDNLVIKRFYGLIDAMQIGVLILYFDSVGIIIEDVIIPNERGWKIWDGTIIHSGEWFKSREQAWTQAVARSNEIRNEQLNQ